MLHILMIIHMLRLQAHGAIHDQKLHYLSFEKPKQTNNYQQIRVFHQKP